MVTAPVVLVWKHTVIYEKIRCINMYIWKNVSCGIRIERLLGTSSLIKREQNAVMNLNCLESPDMSTSDA